MKDGCCVWTAAGAVLTLHASSLQHVVQADVSLSVVFPASHSDDVSFTCRLHDTFIVQILLIDSFSLTSVTNTHHRNNQPEA